MKIEFVKETKVNGDVFYYTRVDGYYVSDSLELSKEKAKEKYQVIIENNGNLDPVKEVIDSIEIEVK